MPDKKWIADFRQREKEKIEAANEARDQRIKDQNERELIVAPFWEAFVNECQTIVRDVSVEARLNRVDGGILVSYRKKELYVGILTVETIELLIRGLPGSRVARQRPLPCS